MNRTVLASLVLFAACADSTDDDVTATTDDVAASATLLVSADFSSTSKTKTIVEDELAASSAIKLLAVGDMSYTAPYAKNDPWAQWAARTYPVMGNHEFNSVAGNGGEQPYDLFNGNNAAGNLTFPAIRTSSGLNTFDFAYSHEITPGWLLVVLNSGVDCAQQSCADQAHDVETWIDAWRGSNGGSGCVIVALHTARWSTLFSGDADNLPWATSVASIWEAAVAHHADIVVQGHVHVYEEFKKLDANGHSSATGTKLFTIGAGGRGQVKPNKSNIAATELVASHDAPINGVLKLALYPGKYGYKFETEATTGSPAATASCNLP